jgi:hypothetical protein
MRLTNLIFQSSFTAIIIMVVYITLHFIPFSWFVDIDEDKYIAFDTCVGSDVVTYQSERVPSWGILGSTYSQIVRFDGQEVTETTISRGTQKKPVSFGYEAGTTGATYQTRWDEPFNTPGVYGANEWITIQPLPFISIKKFNKAEDTKFNVVECSTS